MIRFFKIFILFFVVKKSLMRVKKKKIFLMSQEVKRVAIIPKLFVHFSRISRTFTFDNNCCSEDAKKVLGKSFKPFFVHSSLVILETAHCC